MNAEREHIRVVELLHHECIDEREAARLHYSIDRLAGIVDAARQGIGTLPEETEESKVD